MYYWNEGVPRTIGLIQPLLLLFLSFWRMIAKYFLRDISNGKILKTDTTRALAYGSGKAGRQLVIWLCKKVQKF